MTDSLREAGPGAVLGRARLSAALALGTAILALSTAIVVSAVVPASGARASLRRYYVAIGASQTLGYQPTSGGLQAPTTRGYAHDLIAMEKSRWPGLTLVRIACAGIRLDVALHGGGRCARPAGSEVATASAFLRAHPGQVAFVSVDLGYSSVAACLAAETVERACVGAALLRIRSGLKALIHRLRDAGGPSLRIVGLTHDDPFLADYIGRPAYAPAFAEKSARVTKQFNDLAAAVYRESHVTVAHVGQAFGTGLTALSRLAGRAWVPEDVESVCTLTWTCTDDNPHPNDSGYHEIANAIASAIATWGQ